MINLDILNSYIKKAYSPDKILITQNKIIIIDSFNITISEINIDVCMSGFVSERFRNFNVPIVMTMDEIKQEILTTMSGNHVFNIDSLVPVDFNRKSLLNSITNKYNKVMNNNLSLVYTENIRYNETILTVLEGKASDGQQNLIIDNKYFLVIYKSLFSVTKADDLIISIYDNPNSNWFLAKFTTHKKKEKIDVDLYIPYLKL